MISGLTLANFDTAVRPQDDLFGFVNGAWYAATPIPDDRGRYGTFDVLREQAEVHVREILDEVSAAGNAPATVAAKVGDLYASFLDEQTAADKGILPIADLLARIDAVESATDLSRLLGELARVGVTGPLAAFVNTDDRDPNRYVVYLEQAGIGLPDESYYREDAHEQTRAAYREHLAIMLAHAGEPDPAAAAQAVLDLETRLASAHWDTVTNRDPVKTYTMVSRDALGEASGALDWAAYLAGLAAPEGAFAEVVVRQPPYLEAAGLAVAEVPVETWRSWLRWHVVHTFSPYLTPQMSRDTFDFFGTVLSGVPEQRARWKRGVSLVEDALGEAVGELYVARHFPPHAKARMVELVGNLVEAFRRSFATVPWMGELTREQALAKLDAFTPKIGYPDRWRDYSALTIDRDDLVGNVRRAASFETDRQLAKLGGPVDRGEWFMTPQTVNAYYNPGMNEIVFPAAILQPPFFDVDADDAVNYGGIGAVIGHEVGHGFDDSGSQFDGTGALRDWWTAEDRERFDALTNRLIAQFSGLETRDAAGVKVNGALTVGENIGDLGGLAIGHAAYRISLSDQVAPELDGYTGDQRFFLGWAQVWCGKAREAEARRLITIDPHSPVDLRANAVRNLDAFHAAFEVAPGDGLWLDPADRVTIF